MRPESDQRVGFDGGMDLDASFVKVHIDDATILHVGSQQAERERGSFRPGDRLWALPHVTCLGKKNVTFCVELESADARERLVVKVGHADIQIELVEASLNFY